MNRPGKMVCAVAAFAAASFGQAVCTLHVNTADTPYNISPTLWGIFFEEISNAGEGGLYGELIQNRSFEDDQSTPVHWSISKSGTAAATMALESAGMLNTYQKRALRLVITQVGTSEKIGVANDGFWGMNIISGTRYRITFFAKASAGFGGTLTAALENASGSTTIGTKSISGLTTSWKKFVDTITATGSDPAGRFAMYSSATGTIWLDVVSLFPPTFKNRENGMRLDLANKLNDMKPRFLRFPGGCYVEGDSLTGKFTYFDWKKSLGPIEERPGHTGFWGYYSSDGLGYHDYLQLAEDLGAEPLYVFNCGMSHREVVPIAQIQPWIQDALDAIEYAIGPTTSTWGARRAAAGHPAPFNLRYVEIGNENNFDMANYAPRYPLFYDAITSAYPQIIPIANANVTGASVAMIDEHHYQSPGVMIQSFKAFNNYDRSGPAIFIGEYGSSTNLMGALGDAVYMLGMEQNSEVVKLASFAPLFANTNRVQWGTNLIYFNAAQNYCIPSYYAQKMFSNNMGNVIVLTTWTVRGILLGPITGGILLGTWNTQSQYDDVRVASGSQILFTDNFSGTASQWTVSSGTWAVTGGVYAQTGADAPAMATAQMGAVWQNDTITVRARKTGGAEGFLIGFGVQDLNNYYWWNVGGWGNGLTGIERVNSGSKTLLASRADAITTGQWYSLKIVLNNRRIMCYRDNVLFHDVVDSAEAASPLYVSTSKVASSGDFIIKAVNTGDQSLAGTINLDNATFSSIQASEEVLASASATDSNSLAQPQRVATVTRSLGTVGPVFQHTFPQYSVSVIRLSNATSVHRTAGVDNAGGRENAFFRNNTMFINFTAAQPGRASLSLIDCKGRAVLLCRDKKVIAGAQKLSLRLEGARSLLAPGVYLICVETEHERVLSRVVVTPR